MLLFVLAAGGIPAALLVAVSAVVLVPLVALLGGIVVLLVAPFSPRLQRFRAPVDRILLLGLGLWLIAQALPAYTEAPYLSDEPNRVWGITATALGWVLTLWVSFPYGILIGFAWSANVWLGLAVIARWRCPDWMRLPAVLATVASAVGLGILLAGGVPEPGGRIIEVGIGSWLWFAGTCVVLVAAALPVAQEHGVG